MAKVGGGARKRAEEAGRRDAVEGARRGDVHAHLSANEYPAYVREYYLAAFASQWERETRRG